MEVSSRAWILCRTVCCDINNILVQLLEHADIFSKSIYETESLFFSFPSSSSAVFGEEIRVFTYHFVLSSVEFVSFTFIPSKRKKKSFNHCLFFSHEDFSQRQVSVSGRRAASGIRCLLLEWGRRYRRYLFDFASSVVAFSVLECVIFRVIDWLIDFSFATMPNNALHSAIERGDFAGLQSNVRNFDINAVGKNDETALFKAVGNPSMVEVLLNFYADVNISNVRKVNFFSLFPLSLMSILCPTSSRYILLSLIPHYSYYTYLLYYS